jgi:hypothetical protein
LIFTWTESEKPGALVASESRWVVPCSATTPASNLEKAYGTVMLRSSARTARVLCQAHAADESRVRSRISHRCVQNRRSADRSRATLQRWLPWRRRDDVVSVAEIQKNPCRTTVAEPIEETLAELPFTGNQVGLFRARPGACSCTSSRSGERAMIALGMAIRFLIPSSTPRKIVSADTARTSVPSGGHSSSYLCQHDSVFAAQDRRLADGDQPPCESGPARS